MNLPQSIKDKIKERGQAQMYVICNLIRDIVPSDIENAYIQGAEYGYSLNKSAYSLEQVEKIALTFASWFINDRSIIVGGFNQFSESSLGKALLSESDPWISVEDKLPPKFKNVLALSAKGRIRITCVDNSGTLDEFEIEADNEDRWTHWIEIPKPPQSK